MTTMYKNSKNGKLYTLIEETETTATFKEIGCNGERKNTVDKNGKAYQNYILQQEETKEEKKTETTSIANRTMRTEKVNKTSNALEYERIQSDIWSAIDSMEDKHYTLVEEAKKKKLILRYTDEKTLKTRNLTELFYKSRFNKIDVFMREPEIVGNMDYDKELADSNKSRGYNFFIEKAIHTDSNSIAKYITTVIQNHKVSLLQAQSTIA